MALGNGSTTTAANGGVAVPDNKAPVVNGTNMETLPRQTKQDPNTAFLRAARAGQLDKIQEYLDSGTVRDINTSNANGLNALHLAAKDGHVEVVQELLKRGAIVDAATKKGNTALHIASLAGQEEVVRMLIQHGASINVQSQNGFTPLYMASQENHDGCVKYLLAKGGNQSLATEDGFTPLAVAMQQGHDKVVAVLLENDSRGKVRLPALHIAAKKDDCKAAALLLQNEHNPDITSKSGFTPLHIAAHYGNDRVASLLYERGAQVNYQAKHNITPLHVASKWGKQAMVGLLVAKGADVQARTRDGLTPLHCAARSGHDQVVDMLLENGAPMHSKTKNGLAPLHMAAQGEHVDAARILLYHGAPVDEVTVDYLTALHVAAHCGHVRVAKLLLDRGADPNARALNGFTPLHIACKKNRIKMVELLLKHGASIGATTESGLTPLHVASFMGCMNIVIYLLQHEASPDIPTVRGETPLHLAARANQTDIIRILLRNGAAVDAKAREEQTPLHVASRLGNVDIVMLLLQHGANPHATTKDLYTPLHIAAKEGQEEVASVLLDNASPPSTTTKKGFTPLHLAAKYGHLNVARLLLQRDAAPDAAGKNGVTPLHVAAHYDHQPVALLLLDKGASPCGVAKNGYTALHIAAKKNQMDIATTLLEYGAQADAESKAGFTPLHLSAQEGHSDMSSLLLEHQSNPNHSSKNGLTPLHLSAQEDRLPITQLLLRAGAERDKRTKAGYTPLHVACHHGHVPTVRLLLEHGAEVNPATQAGYTPLHQAAQQGHVLVISLLLKHRADPNALTNNGQTALGIANKLGYISVVEELKVVTEVNITTTTTVNIEEKYKVVVPEAMQETYMSDSEDEGGGGVAADEHPAVAYGQPAHAQHVYLPFYQGQMNYTREDTLADQQQYKYMTVDDMKSLGDDSMRMDVTNDEKSGDFRNSMAPSHVSDFIISPQHAKEYYATNPYTVPDNVDINRQPITVGREWNALQWQLCRLGAWRPAPGHQGLCRDSIPSWRNFLVSFLVDARGGAMRGCRHSGVRVIVPPRCAGSPTRITCRYVRPKRMPHPPPLMEGEALASRVLELGPVGSKFLGPVIIEVPHFASLRGKQREIIVLRSDNGETWKEHTLESNEEAIQDVLNHSFEGEELSQIEDLHTNRITRVLTNDFPHYFAVVSRVRQEVHAIGPDGGTVSSSAVPMVQAVFPPNALTKKIRVGLQAQAMEPDMVSKLLGHGVAVSPIVTVEPRRRKFHKAISLSLPAPRAHSQGMINQYSGSAPTLRLLCSIMGGQNKAVWEDVTGSTPLTFVKDCVSFTTTVSARFWLMDCRNITDSARMATELYTQAAHVPFMAKFVVFAKRVSQLEARVRVFCMTDDKEDKTLEHQEHFTEIAKSKDVEVLEGKDVYMEFAGNLVPILQSGDQPKLDFKAFRENRLAFTMRLRDQDEDPVGRIVFMNDPKVVRGEPTQTPLCTLNLVLPKDILPGRDSQSDLLSIDKDHSYLQHGGISAPDTIHRADFRLSDICSMLGEDWAALAQHLDIPPSDIELINDQYGEESPAQRAMVMFRLWLRQKGEVATGNGLEQALKKIGRHDIVQNSICNIQLVTDDMEQAVARVRLDQSGFDELREELGPSRDASLRRDAKLQIFGDNDVDDDITVTKAEGDTVGDLSMDELSEKNDDGIDPLTSTTDKDLSSTLSSFIAHKAQAPPIITNDQSPPDDNFNNDSAALEQITQQLNRLESIPRGTGDANGNTPPPSPAVFGLDNMNERNVNMFMQQERVMDVDAVREKGAHHPVDEFIQHEATATLDSQQDAQDTDTSEADLTSIEHELVTADPIANLKKNVIDTLTFLHQERNDFLPQEDIIIPSRKDDHVANSIDLSVIDTRSTVKRPEDLDLNEHIYENVEIILNQQPARIGSVEDVIEAATAEVTKVIEEAEDTVNENKQVRFDIDQFEDDAHIRSDEAFKFLENELASSPGTNDLDDFLREEIRAAGGKSGIPVAKPRRQSFEQQDRDEDCTSPVNENEILSKIPISGGKAKIKTIKKHSKDPLKEFVKLSENVNWDDEPIITETITDPIIKTTVTRITTTNTTDGNSKIPVLQQTTTTETFLMDSNNDSPTKSSKIPVLLTEATRIMSTTSNDNNGQTQQLVSPGSKASKSSTLDSDSDTDSRRSPPTCAPPKELKGILKKKKRRDKGRGEDQEGVRMGGGSVDGSNKGLRTIGSSSGSDVALHEGGAEPSDDESEDFYQNEPHFTETTVEETDPVTGAKITRTIRTMSQSLTSPGAMSEEELRNSMQSVMDKFMTEERQPQ